MDVNSEIQWEAPIEGEHFKKARKLLADELRLYYDPSTKDEDLMPVLALPAPFRGDRFNRYFGFSINQGFRRQVFVIHFQIGPDGNPIFERRPVGDPSLLRLRLTGQLSKFDKGRLQIERVLDQKESRLN
jgi:hypothetical protein